MIISFIGHALVCSKSDVEEIVKECILANITDNEPVVCYLGGRGDFDEICASACRKLKRKHPFIELVYVTPYLNLSEQAKIKEMMRWGLYNSSIYPLNGKTPPRFAILKRNEWMMINADIVIAYVKRNYGGAHTALSVAKRKGKRIINIAEALDNTVSKHTDIEE